MEERTIIDTGQGFGQAPAYGEATRVIDAPSAPVAGYADRTMQAITVTCPVCGTPNGPGEVYCQDCGLLFTSAPTEIEPLPDVSQLPRLVDQAGGRELMLNPGVNSVGRESADVLLQDPTVSRRHAQVTLEGGQLVVEDLGSTNGSFVGGRRLAPGERASAFNGDAVKFGSVALVLTLPGGEARSASAEAAAPAAAAEERGAPAASLALVDGTEFPLYSGLNTLGRRSSNQVVIPDAFASGKHAEITVNADGTAVLTDSGSTNGTFLGDERLAPNAPVTLSEGTAVRFAKTTMIYRPAAADAAAPAAGEQTLLAGDITTAVSTQPDDGA